MSNQMMYYAMLLSKPNYLELSAPIMTVVNLGLRILITIVVAITGIRLLLASIAMATAVGEEKMQKKDDVAKAIKGFGITAALTAAVLGGGPSITKWIMTMVDSTAEKVPASAIMAGGSALMDWVVSIF